MTVTFIGWGVAGLVTGTAHAAALWRAAHIASHSLSGTAWRLPAVAALLTTAAVGGGLLPAAGGWACGLLGTGGLIYMRDHHEGDHGL